MVVVVGGGGEGVLAVNGEQWRSVVGAWCTFVWRGSVLQYLSRRLNTPNSPTMSRLTRLSICVPAASFFSD